ncbi:MAG: hypothetical protein ACRDNY_08760 [Gaiellaceae bacterium]
MRLLTIAVVLMLALAGAGCGGDDEAAGDTEAAVTETTDGTTTDGTEAGDLDTLASGECQELVQASVQLSQALGAAGNSGDDLDQARELFDELAAGAPDEIREDVQVLADAYAEYADVFADIQVEPGQVPDAEALQRLQEALASIDQEEVTAASQRLSAWATANC